MRTLRVILASGVLTAAALAGLAPAASGAPAQQLYSCAPGYTMLYVTNTGPDYYLDAEGIGNEVEVTNTPTCWHPGDQDTYSYITDNSGNCLDWDNSVGYVIMLQCNSTIVSEYWYVVAHAGGYSTFSNKYAIVHHSTEYLLGAESFLDNSGVTLNGLVNGSVSAYSEWYHISNNVKH